MSSAQVDVALEYVRLGLRFDRLESGFVDAYTGDPRIRAAVEDEPAPTPQGLRDRARALLAELDVAGLPADRTEFHFTDVYWPDFRRVDFLRALRDYSARHRRFGG